MDVGKWHPVQLGLFWLLIVVFGFPIWLGLSLVGDFVTGRYQGQDWFEVIPIVLAFVTVFAVVTLGLMVTWRWLDARPAKPGK